MSPAFAQLDQTCVVSALNRTATVQEDGTWVLPNIPASMGPVRIRATCTAADGTTRSGESEPIIIPPDGIIRIPEIRFGSLTPVPERLTLAGSATRLTTPGETVRLTLTATYPDGTTAELTTDPGTALTVSNPRVAELDATGQLTAHTSGTVLVTAMSQGVVALLRLDVVLSDDSDGDGLPDDFEIMSGLDPTNPTDALADPDDDGLSTLAELQAGLDPFTGDGDDDRLRDGGEVEAGTDPARPDTDGDGVPDGLEVRLGSDPLDPESYDLSSVLEGLELTPEDLVLIFNTVLGEGSRGLRLIAYLKGGTTLELTAARGVAYRSSDLAVASFGAEPGRVFAGQDGNAVITADYGGQSAGATVTVRAFSPTPLGRLRLPAPADAVALAGGYAFLAATSAGLVVADVADPRSPRQAARLATPGTARDVRLWKNLALVADAAGGLRVIDVTDPTAPAELASLALPGARDLAVEGERVYVADGAGLSVVDLADPASPVLLGRLDTPGTARGVDVEDGWALVADSTAGVHVVDVRDGANPVLAGSTHSRSNATSRAADLAVRGRRAFVADGSNGTLGGLRVIDWSDPASPFLAGSSGDGFGLLDVAVEHDFALTADYYFVNAVPIFHTGAPDPVFVAPLDFALWGDDNGRGVAVRDGLVFMVGVRQGEGSLFIGRYVIFDDDAGRRPTVRLTAPAADAVARERNPLTLAADARDDVRVAAVDFLVGREVVATDYAAPFRIDYPVPAGARELLIEAVARDLAGNRAITAPRTVAVVEDPVIPMGEVGRIAELTHEPRTVVLRRVYDRPVVFAGPLSYNGADTALVRVTEVRPDRFTAFVHEPPDRDGPHDAEIVDYVVLEAGSWRLVDGTRLEVATLDTSATVGALLAYQEETWEEVRFGFDKSPIVLTQVQTGRDPHWVGTRQLGPRFLHIGLISFSFALEEEEANRAPHGEETVGWLAVEPSNGLWSGLPFRAKQTLSSFDSAFNRAAFDRDLSGLPRRVVAVLGSYHDADSAHLRCRGISAVDVELKVEEDTTYDGETSHRQERVHLLVFGGDGILTAEPR